MTGEQTVQLESHNIKIIEKEIEKLEHMDGNLRKIIFKDGTTSSVNVLYSRCAFEQHSSIPQGLGCELTDDGYIKVDQQQKTTVHGIFACGDNTTRMRTVANAVAMGTIAGMMANREIISETF